MADAIKKVQAAITAALKKAEKAGGVSSSVKHVGKKADALAHKGLESLSKIAVGVIERFSEVGQGWTSKGAGTFQKWLAERGALLAQELPKIFTALTAKPVVFGKGLTAKFAKTLNAKVAEILGKGASLKGIKWGAKFVSELALSLKWRVINAAEAVAEGVRGTLPLGAGHVQGSLTGTATHFRDMLRRFGGELAPRKAKGK